MKTKFIFVTGGVLSGIGKGVSAASLGRLLKARGYKVFSQKLDPYLNVDPGTMSPYQHGEVYVTDDGGETDLDLGHYERFIDETLTKNSNLTQGRIMLELLEEERRGDYGGATVQIIPHVTNKIIKKIVSAAEETEADFVITEIGGTVGDIESDAFYKAVSQFIRRNKGNTCLIHASFLPYLDASKEFKSKPTQHSLSTLNSLGIFPDLILLRANREIDPEMVFKVAEKSFLDHENVIPVPNVNNIYEVPVYLERYEMAQKVLTVFGMDPDVESDLSDWEAYVGKLRAPKKNVVKIGMVGKYSEFEDAYKSIVEALTISGNWRDTQIKLKWIDASSVTEESTDKLAELDGVVILPGFGPRGFDGKVVTAAYTREQDIPTLGVCYGLQAMTVAYAKKKGIEDATSFETGKEGTYVIDFVRGKNAEDNLGGTLRLGASTTILKKDSVACQIYGKEEVVERHRHRYEVNGKYIDQIQDDDFVFSGFDSINNLAEVCEMPKLRFYVGLQAHPEFNARPLREHPLFGAFVSATSAYHQEKRKAFGTVEIKIK